MENKERQFQEQQYQGDIFFDPKDLGLDINAETQSGGDSDSEDCQTPGPEYKQYAGMSFGEALQQPTPELPHVEWEDNLVLVEFDEDAPTPGLCPDFENEQENGKDEEEEEEKKKQDQDQQGNPVSNPEGKEAAKDKIVT